MTQKIIRKSFQLLSTTGAFLAIATQQISAAAGGGATNQTSGASGNIEPIKNFAVSGRLTDYAGATDGSTFAYYLVFIWRALIFVAGMAVLISLVTGAIDWINAGGDKSKIEKAREKMTQAVVGFVVLVGLIAIAQFLQVIFGINILSPNIPTVADPQYNL